jgi:hypothetical protein
VSKLLSTIRITVLGLIFICFFFPFVAASCSDGPIILITGMQLSFGFDINSSSLGSDLNYYQMQNNNSPLHSDINAFALFPLISIIIGIITCLFKSKFVSLISLVINLTGITFLCLLANQINNTSNYIQYRIEYGLYLSLSGFIFSTILSSLNLLVVFNVFRNKIKQISS